MEKLLQHTQQPIGDPPPPLLLIASYIFSLFPPPDIRIHFYFIYIEEKYIRLIDLLLNIHSWIFTNLHLGSKCQTQHKAYIRTSNASLRRVYSEEKEKK